MICTIMVAKNPLMLILRYLNYGFSPASVLPFSRVSFTFLANDFRHVPVFEGGTRYSGPVDVARQTLAADGVRGFYRGLLPNMLKVLPATGISYSVFSVVSKRVQGRSGE